jgi:plasmid stabilization system protein ParE
MARVIWAEPALLDLDTIADYIALDKPDAAHKLVREVFSRVGRLQRFPKMGSVPPEIPDLPYRQLHIPPCRVFYRISKKNIYVVHVMRGEQLVKRELLEKRLESI